MRTGKMPVPPLKKSRNSLGASSGGPGWVVLVEGVRSGRQPMRRLALPGEDGIAWEAVLGG